MKTETSFRDQFIACGKDESRRLGAFETHQLAFPERTPDGKLVTEMTSQVYDCLKFGGRCSSGNPKCREMRGVGPMPIQRDPLTVLRENVRYNSIDPLPGKIG